MTLTRINIFQHFTDNPMMKVDVLNNECCKRHNIQTETIDPKISSILTLFLNKRYNISMIINMARMLATYHELEIKYVMKKLHLGDRKDSIHKHIINRYDGDVHVTNCFENVKFIKNMPFKFLQSDLFKLYIIHLNTYFMSAGDNRTKLLKFVSPANNLLRGIGSPDQKLILSFITYRMLLICGYNFLDDTFRSDSRPQMILMAYSASYQTDIIVYILKNLPYIFPSISIEKAVEWCFMGALVNQDGTLLKYLLKTYKTIDLNYDYSFMIGLFEFALNYAISIGKFVKLFLTYGAKFNKNTKLMRKIRNKNDLEILILLFRKNLETYFAEEKHEKFDLKKCTCNKDDTCITHLISGIYNHSTNSFSDLEYENILSYYRFSCLFGLIDLNMLCIETKRIPLVVAIKNDNFRAVKNLVMDGANINKMNDVNSRLNTSVYYDNLYLYARDFCTDVSDEIIEFLKSNCE